MPPRQKTPLRMTPTLRALVLPVGCYLLGTLLGSLYFDFTPEAAGSMLLLLLMLFYAAFSLFGPLIVSTASAAFGLLTGGISAGLLADFSLAGLVSLFFLVFLLAPCLLLLASYALRSALYYMEILLATRRENRLTPLTGRLLLTLAACLLAVLLYGLLVRLLL